MSPLPPLGLHNSGDTQSPVASHAATSGKRVRGTFGAVCFGVFWFSFFVCLFFVVVVFFVFFVFCLTSQHHASVSQGRICTDNFTCCHAEIETADQTFHLTQSQYTDIGPTSPSTDPITPGAWQGSHWSANFFFFFLSHWYGSTPKKSRRKRDSNPGSSTLDELVFWSFLQDLQLLPLLHQLMVSANIH